MCVILAVNHDAEDVTAGEFEQAAWMHDDGFGIAWYEGSKVHYVKRMDAIELVNFRPTKPYVMHFRLATEGEKITKLCHPFAISRGSPLRRKGWAKRVLFHNGHVTDWERLLCLTKRHIPNGPYSDSRAVAIAIHSLGNNLLTLPFLNGNKWLVMDTSKDEPWQAYGTWEKGDDNILRSNTYHLNYDQYDAYEYIDWGSKGTTSKRTCMYATCDKELAAGHDFYCEYHWPLITCAREACQTRVGRTSMLLCEEHLKEAAPNKVKGKMFCQLCQGELVLQESKQCGYCVSCVKNACASCGQPLHRDEKNAYCTSCLHQKAELYCPHCGVAMTTIERAQGSCHKCKSWIGGECIDKD